MILRPQLKKWFVITVVKSTVTGESLGKWCFPMSYVHQLDLSPVFISFPLFCLWTLPALFSGFVTKRRGGAIRRKMNVLLACRQILPFQNTQQICVCACPVILQLTCALRVGLWDPFNDRDGQRWRQVEDSAVWLVWSACVCVCVHVSLYWFLSSRTYSDVPTDMLAPDDVTGVVTE